MLCTFSNFLNHLIDQGRGMLVPIPAVFGQEGNTDKQASTLEVTQFRFIN